jgi:hypothetical protein
MQSQAKLGGQKKLNTFGEICVEILKRKSTWFVQAFERKKSTKQTAHGDEQLYTYVLNRH